MIRTLQIAIARRAHRNASRALRSYMASSNHDWNVLVAMAYERAECDAANRLARLIDPAAIVRAF